MAWKKGSKKKATPRRAVAYAVGDIVEYLTNSTQEVRKVRVTDRRAILPGKTIAGFEGLELRADESTATVTRETVPTVQNPLGVEQFDIDNTTGRALWGFDYQIIRVNGKLLLPEEATAE